MSMTLCCSAKLLIVVVSRNIYNIFHNDILFYELLFIKRTLPKFNTQANSILAKLVL